jgi:signal transduction histidine kinase
MLAGEEDGWMRLSVADEGVGISTEVAELAVRPFRQVDGRLARKHGGTGLGLSIVNGLIERHGGRLSFDSAPNQGTTVSLDFPVDAEAAATQRYMPQTARVAERLAG